MFGFGPLLRLLDGHQIDGPAGQLRRQAHILSAAPDGNRQVVLIDHDIHRMLFFVDHDALHLGRRQRADHKLRRIGRPEDDIDAFTG